MGWATEYIADLAAGKTVEFRPMGKSMEPKVPSGALCKVAPCTSEERLQLGDVVLCRVGRKQYLHLVKGSTAGFVLIGNNRGHTNGWIPRSQVYGKLVRVLP